jgi:putative hemolysin
MPQSKSGRTKTAIPQNLTLKLIDLKSFFGIFASPLENLLSCKALNSVYTDIICERHGANFFQMCLEHLHVRYVLSAQGLQDIPSSGPLVVIANHPFGGLEGVILGALLTQCRPDVKYLGNYLLQRIAELRDWILPIDPFGQKRLIATNVRSLREALRWVRAGGALVTFPAGEVSRLIWRQGIVADGSWSPHIAALVRHTKATVLPVFFPGRNSVLFQSVGLVHPRLCTLLLPHELVNKQAKTVAVTLGKPISWSKLARFDTDTALIAHLRLTTYALDQRWHHTRQGFSIWGRRSMQPMALQPIAPPSAASVLQAEVAAPPAAQRLMDGAEFAVYLAPSAQIPLVLQDIGRLRELTFRSIGEGTGKAVDLDHFDAHYLHLFVWDKMVGAVVGAYRLGLTDVILRHYGPRGLYTNTLFRFKPAFFHRLASAIELGRAFIRAEYQRRSGCLWLLWRGISAFLVRHPQYNCLFGPLSISQEYHAVSRNVMVRFLWDHKLDAELSGLPKVLS